MKIWQVSTYRKSDNQLDEVSELYISAEYAMKDWFFNHLEWQHIETPKFGGVVLEHWQAESELHFYILEGQHVNGSNS